MADDSTVALWQEIRDLQKKHTELLQAFVEGQQQGLTKSKASSGQSATGSGKTKTGVGPVDSALGIRAGWSIPVAAFGIHSHCFQPIQKPHLGPLIDNPAVVR
jgi:hypothetical protein